MKSNPNFQIKSFMQQFGDRLFLVSDRLDDGNFAYAVVPRTLFARNFTQDDYRRMAGNQMVVASLSPSQVDAQSRIYWRACCVDKIEDKEAYLDSLTRFIVQGTGPITGITTTYKNLEADWTVNPHTIIMAQLDKLNAMGIGEFHIRQSSSSDPCVYLGIIRNNTAGSSTYDGAFTNEVNNLEAGGPPSLVNLISKGENIADAAWKLAAHIVMISKPEAKTKLLLKEDSMALYLGPRREDIEVRTGWPMVVCGTNRYSEKLWACLMFDVEHNNTISNLSEEGGWEWLLEHGRFPGVRGRSYEECLEELRMKLETIRYSDELAWLYREAFQTLETHKYEFDQQTAEQVKEQLDAFDYDAKDE